MKPLEGDLARIGPARRLAALLLAVLAGCGHDAPAPRWIALGAELRLDASREPRTTLHAWKGRNVELVAENGGATLRVPLRREDWQPVPEYDHWQVPIEIHPPESEWIHSLQLATPAGEIPRARLARLANRQELVGFLFLNHALAVGGVGDAPPEESTLTWAVRGPESPREGRVELAGFSGSGVVLLPGARASCTLEVPAGSALRFATSAEPILGPTADGDESLFRVRLDGEVLFEHRQRVARSSARAWHVVPLPVAGSASARLDLEVEGALANAVFVDPRLGPAEVGRRAQRPWRETRPDIVVFLADTFRADNLAAYGGSLGVTPNLDALAEQSLCFLRAWSTAPWTLPAHASIFSGYYPHQVRASGRDCRLPQEVETVVERLTHAGYRSGAVTEGGFVSGNFGMDQGFDYFSERVGDLPGLLEEARAFLDADDGRPAFLFVHTYRAHWPYRVSDRTRAELGERLGIAGQATDLLEEVAREAQRQGAAPVVETDFAGLARTPRMLELLGQLNAHYLGAVADLDREVAGFLAHLAESGVLASGYLVFTSDHGEAFGEHADLFHGRDPYEEQMRVPLLIAGGGLAGRRVEHPTSLVDLAPTLAEMAGLPGSPDWPGRSLLGLAANRPVFGFESSGQPDDSLFVLENEKKVLCRHAALDGERVLGAYDLGLDALERHDQAATDATWPRELLDKYGAAIEVMLLPLVEGEAAELDPSKAAELKALGY